MKHWKAEEIRNRVKEVLWDGVVIPRHNENGHFYEIRDTEELRGFKVEEEDGSSFIAGPVYPSVTGKLQRLKDEGLVNYKMNRAIEYVFNHYKDFTDANVMEHLDLAKRVSQDILRDAGDIGTRIHDMREKIFREWINTGIRPTRFESFIPPEEEDVRTISAMRALEKFCIEKDYIPVELELRVYSHELKTAGSLDDIGLMRDVLKEGDKDCPHAVEHIMKSVRSGNHTCLNCGYKYRYMFVLMDLKSSNQFKDHYFFQVALYWKFFTNLTGLKPEMCFILKVSKEDGTYKIEDLKRPAKLAQYATALIKTDEGVEFIKTLRKDNQKVVAPLMQL